MMTFKWSSAVRHQTIDNFGASLCWWTDPVYESYSREDMERIALLLFSCEEGAGLSCIRFNIGAGSQWYDAELNGNAIRRASCFQHGPEAAFDWTAHEGQQWMLRRARELGVPCAIAFANSPPAWLTVNGHATCGAQPFTTNLKFGNEHAFGSFLARVMKHFEECGLAFDYLSPINEPQVPWSEPSQEGCRYSNEDTIRAVLAIREELDREGVSTRLLINESNNLLSLIDLDLVRPYASLLPDGIDMHSGWQYGGKYCEQAKDIFDLPDVRRSVAPIIAAHSYGTDTPDMLSFARQFTRATMERYGGYRFWMSEYCVFGLPGVGRGLGMDVALHVARVIHADLTEMDASAWQWWLAVSGEDFPDGLVYVDLDKQGRPGGIHPSKLLWIMGHYSRFLRPGSVRVSLSCDLPADDVLASGWLDASGHPVIVLTNLSGSQQEILLDGLPPEAVLWVTDAMQNLHAAIVSTLTPISLPPRSMATLIG